MKKIDRYPWTKDHPDAVLGTVYLYFAYGRDPDAIPDEVLNWFVVRHQDRGRLTISRVRAALDAVRNIDGGQAHFQPARILREIWEALLPFLNHSPRRKP